MRLAWLGFTVGWLIVLLPASAFAYIGPGAGFTFVTSFFLVFVTFFLAFLTLLTWPIRWVVQKFRGRKAMAKSRVQRVVVVGPLAACGTDGAGVRDYAGGVPSLRFQECQKLSVELSLCEPGGDKTKNAQRGELHQQ